MTRAQGIPILIDPLGGQDPLERIYLGAGTLSEDWLQSLIHKHPAILPIGDIEPGFGVLIPAAREVPCGHGYIDNVYLTAAGDIVLVEAKLWRNSEMRREVVAQVLDYVAALTSMSFEDFERAVSKGQDAPKKLFDLVAGNAEALDEPQFIDAVTTNLRRGRMLVMVLGDGIRTETELLGDLLQSHAGAHFTFALVELGAWRKGSGELLVVPSTLARTVMIERGVVRLERSDVRIEPVPVETKPRAQSISMHDFMAMLGERNPALPQAINAFLDALEPFGVYPDLKAGLSLKADLPGFNRPVNFGYIDKQGKFWTNPAAGILPEHVWRPYFETLAALIDGQVIDEASNRFVAARPRSGPRIDQFLPMHQEAMVAAIGTVIRTLRDEDA